MIIEKKKRVKFGRKKVDLSLRLSRFQSLRNVTATQMGPDSKSIEPAIEVISSYLSIDPLPRRPNHDLTYSSLPASIPPRDP